MISTPLTAICVKAAVGMGGYKEPRERSTARKEEEEKREKDERFILLYI
jgi:hypothetical protein